MKLKKRGGEKVNHIKLVVLDYNNEHELWGNQKKWKS